MTRQRPPELFTTERPVRSEFARPRFDAGTERKYARRRRITIGVLLFAACVTGYVLFDRNPPNPATLPTIHAEGEWKQKPADPGGIDIPHQDVRVYDQLEGKSPAASLGTGGTEHLLPPPEVPREMPKPAAMAAPAPEPVAPAPVAAPTAPVAKAVVKTAQPDPILQTPRAKIVATTAAPAPAPVPAPVAAAPEPVPAPQELSIDQVIANTKAPAAQPEPAAPVPAPASGKTSIQLASTTDAAGAHAMMQELQKKYAAQLKGVTLQVVRADLGAKGIFYRIMGQGLAEGEASHICAALKQQKAGCILVRR